LAKNFLALSYCIVRIGVYKDCIKKLASFKYYWRFEFGVANSSN